MTTEPSAKRGRSSIQFPYYDLDDAVSIADTVYRRVGTSSCTLDQLAAWLGHTTTRSGAFRLRVGAARMFGVIRTEAERVWLTDLGRAIINPDTTADAKTSVFLNIELYRAVFERYRGHQLPPDVALEAEMVALGVVPTQADKARQAFLRSAEQAGFFREGRQRLIKAVAPSPDATASRGTDHVAPRIVHSPTDEHASSVTHPFIEGLLGALPPPGSVWPADDRKKWLQTAESIFGLLYQEPT